mgnify:FL=1
MRYDSILKEKEETLENLLLDLNIPIEKLLEITRVLHETFEYADTLSFDNETLKLKNK